MALTPLEFAAKTFGNVVPPRFWDNHERFFDDSGNFIPDDRVALDEIAPLESRLRSPRVSPPPSFKESDLPDVHITQSDLDNLYSSPLHDEDHPSVPGDEDYPSVFGPEFLLLPPAALLYSAFPGPALAASAALAAPFVGYKLGQYVGGKLSQDGGLAERVWNRLHPPKDYDSIATY